MMNAQQRALYDAFYAFTHRNRHLDRKTEVLVGLGAAMALDCYPCTRYYLNLCREAGIGKGAVAEVLAKVMAVAAGQKRLQAEEVLARYAMDLDGFEEEDR
jgi:alkylhydroperoxidase/carboxymuconolactone decarboxylase family protein YurZ